MNIIQRDYLQYGYVLEPPVGRCSRGSILFVHGSAPFNLDGRIPVEGLDSPYARTTYYRDLSDGLRTAGWSTLRYNKVGVHDTEIDSDEYATTDFAALAGQLRALWRLLPTDRPRIVFAWSEGTLHVRALPIDEIDAVVLLGGIATNIGDVIQAQGGPSPDEMRGYLDGKDRREMLGIDRPVGRLVDELAFESNWKVFSGARVPPLLILHGAQDQEVPVAQTKVWEDCLPHDRVTITVEKGYDHRFMPRGEYDPMVVAQKVATWLDELFPIAGNR